MRKFIMVLTAAFMLMAFRMDLTPEVGPSHFWGAWERTTEQGKIVKIYTPSWFVYATYTDTEFINAGGGTWTLDADGITETYEFNTIDPEKVGTSASYSFGTSHEAEPLELIKGGTTSTWNRIDSYEGSEMFGAYRFKGRERDGEMSFMTPGPRKTMKVLSGTRFQWAAINTETRQFFGTGGGTYTAKDGKYTENIEFFSRDNSRVGASLEFDYELKDRDWHHKGFSSRGDPMYEIWGNQDKE